MLLKWNWKVLRSCILWQKCSKFVMLLYLSKLINLKSFYMSENKQSLLRQITLDVNSGSHLVSCWWKNTGVGCHFFLQGSSQPRDWTQVSCTAGRFFTNWATKEALVSWVKFLCGKDVYIRLMTIKFSYQMVCSSWYTSMFLRRLCRYCILYIVAYSQP